jgi:hypothetical protein
MLSDLYINNDPNCPVKTVTDKAYFRSFHLHLFHADAELMIMNPHLLAVAEALDSCNKQSHWAVQGSFMSQVTQFKFLDCFQRHQFFSKWAVKMVRTMSSFELAKFWV